jgi:hypothetical protein
VGWAALGGGVIGGLAAKLHDAGFPDDRLKKLAEGLTPNSSALVAVIDHRWVAEVEQELAHEQANIVTQSLSDDIRKQLTTSGSAVYTVVADGDTVVAATSSTTMGEMIDKASAPASATPTTDDKSAMPPSDTTDTTPPTP